MGEHHESTTWVVEPLRGGDLGDEPTLVMIAGPEIGTHVAVDRPSMTVGRDADCELSILMLDVDHFRSINDGAGHLVGDDVLRGLVERILEITRQEDSVTRYGGDEFVIVMPETELEGAKIFGERLREVVEERGFESDEERVRATVSIGAIACTEETQTAEKLLEAADRQLYTSKRAGRNCVS